MKKKIFLAVFLCCGMFAAMAQTAADSLAIVSADWQTEPLQKGMLYKKAVFSSLYGVPQEVSIFEISPKHYRFDVLVHNPKEETSVAARHAGAVAAINGSYFDMKAGNSVCYLRKDGVVIDTTSTRGSGNSVQWSCAHKEGQAGTDSLEQAGRKGMYFEKGYCAGFRSFDAEGRASVRLVRD